MKTSLIFGVLILVGCESERNSPKSDAGLDPKRIPAVSASPNCDPADQSIPGLCEWVAATDAVVVGIVQSVKPVYFPAYVMWEADSRDTCDATVEPAMKITLEVEQTLHGGASESLEIFIGREQRLRFDPQPILDEDSFKWNGSQGIEAGQRLGFGLVESSGVWTPNYRDFFEVYDGIVMFQPQEGDRCAEISPIDVNGLPLAEVRSQIAACNFADPNLGADLKRFDTPDVLRKQGMGLCWEASPNPEPECVSDSDCSVGEICSNQFCQGE